jgi:N6-L-threonylcarbamoyladenine synthase
MQKTDIHILAIESSCDETAAAVISNGKVVSNVVHSQAIHEIYGGVVPELASRAHQQQIVPTVKQALAIANVSASALQAVAFTQGPGLLGALLVGACFAKSLALGLGIPLIAVHHIRAHVLANFIEGNVPEFPFLCLVASGGHTQLILVRDYAAMEVLGQTQDDAIGEAYDKMAKMMGFPYPGGALIDQYAAKGDASKFQFPITTMPDLDFSFSGIKAAFMRFIQRHTAEDPHFITHNCADICASIQQTLVRMLITKVEKAMLQTGLTRIAVGGGVAANQGLQQALKQLAAKQQWTCYIPAQAYCTDNAAMIAMAAHHQYTNNHFATWDTNVKPNMPL